MPLNNQIKTELVSKKWEQVYHTIPDDGSSTRFKDIIKKLPKFSRSTISAALTYFCFNGLIKKEVKSKKTVLYSRNKKTVLPLEAIDHEVAILRKEYGSNLDDLTNLYLHVKNTRVPYQLDYLLQLKAEGKDEELKTAQIMMINEILRTIDQRLIGALQDYVKEQNKEKAMIDFNNEIKLHHVPTLRELIKIVDNIGLDNDVLHMLYYKMRQKLISDDMEHLKTYQKRKEIKPTTQN